MTRQDGTPVTAPGNAAASPATAPVAEAVAATGAVIAMRRSERTAAAARRAGSGIAEVARELWLRPDRLLHVMWHGKPESMAEHRAYVKSRAWVPPGMEGGVEKAVTGAGLFYHLVVARPLLAVANTLGAAAVRPLRLLCVALLVALLVLLVLS